MIISVTISVVVDMCSRGDSLTPGPVGYFMSLLALIAPVFRLSAMMTPTGTGGCSGLTNKLLKHAAAKVSQRQQAGAGDVKPDDPTTAPSFMIVAP